MRLLFIVALFWCVAIEAATNTSPTALLSDVQNTCTASSDGDTVIVPAGNVGWAGTLNPGHNVILQFQGTIITDAVSQVTGSTILRWTLNNNAEAAIVGATWRGISGQSSPDVGTFVIDGNLFRFRVCSNTFSFLNNRTFQEHGWVNGVHDHNLWINNSFQQYIEVWDDAYGGGQFGDLSWNDPDFSGTTNGLYLESNTFLQTGPNMNQVIDCMGGARVFVRNNIFSNCVATTHGTESTGRQRSVRIFEVYTNQFYLNAAAGVGNATSGIWRGGSGVSFGNTYTYFGPNPGANWFGPNLVCYREISQFTKWQGANGTNGFDLNASGNPFDTGTHTGSAGATVLTDGTKTWTVNGWTTNIIWNVTKNLASRITANTATTITYDTAGPTVSGGTLLTFDPGDTYRVMAVLAAIDQPGRGQQATPFNANSDPATVQTWQGEALDPIYSSGNTLNGSSGMDVGSGYPSILLGRDYFNGPKPGWTALPFPHPLISGLPQILYGLAITDGPTGNGSAITVQTNNTFNVLFGFPNLDPSPTGNLVQAPDGNLYGATLFGGAGGFGNIFRLTTTGGYTSLFDFNGTTQGKSPNGSLVALADGNLWGTCSSGGANNNGCIFKISTNGTFAVVYSFSLAGTTDGISPFGGLYLASDGNLWGMANTGGANNQGSVFNITTAGSFTLKHSFFGLDGANPFGTLVQASDGNLYAMTKMGGAFNVGSIFQITLGGSVTVEYSFTMAGTTDGQKPEGNLIQGVDAGLYGMASAGGANSLGSIFRVTTNGTFTLLHSFAGGADGSSPLGSLVQTDEGKLWGMANTGGSSGFGTAFNITTNGSFTLVKMLDTNSGDLPDAGFIAVRTAPPSPPGPAAGLIVINGNVKVTGNITIR